MRFAIFLLILSVALVAEDALVGCKHSCRPAVIRSLRLRGGSALSLRRIGIQVGPERVATAVRNGHELVAEAKSHDAVKTRCVSPVTRKAHHTVTISRSVGFSHIRVHARDGVEIVVLERHEGQVGIRINAGHITGFLVRVIDSRHGGGDLLVYRVDDGAESSVHLRMAVGTPERNASAVCDDDLVRALCFRPVIIRWHHSDDRRTMAKGVASG